MAAGSGAAAARRDLARDEARGGHTLARHVGLSDEDLRARLAREKRIAAASTFEDRATAEAVVGEALGSLHEDLEAEHGTPQGALDAFLEAAGPAERRALASEARALARRIEGWPVARVRVLLADELGCAWWPARAREVRELLARAARQ